MSDNQQLQFDFPERVLDFELDESSHDCHTSPEDGCQSCKYQTEEDNIIVDK